MQPLVLSRDSLSQHLEQVEIMLQLAMDRSAELTLEIDEGGDPIVAGIVGAGCEQASHNRGHRGAVAPWRELSGGLWSWLGYREEWAIHKPGPFPTFAFRSSGATVHFGFRAIEPKPQMFRAEWAGPIRVSGTYQMQAEGAGHPHWQFDAMESLLAPASQESAREFAAVIRAEYSETSPQDFVPSNIKPSEIESVVASRQMAAIHFASAAPWWRSAPEDSHTHAPSTVMELRAWLERTLRYLNAELGRV